MAYGNIERAFSGMRLGTGTKLLQLSVCLYWQGIEDYYGDMDFKMAGTNKGVTALQVL